MRFAHGILELRQLRLRLSDFFYVRLRRECLEKCVSGECKGGPGHQTGERSVRRNSMCTHIRDLSSDTVFHGDSENMRFM